MRQADNSSKNLRETLLITFIGGALDFLLAIAKFAYGILTGLDAILADGIHSLSDFVSDAILYIFVKFSYQPRDRRCPYGNRKIEGLTKRTSKEKDWWGLKCSEQADFSRHPTSR